ncbi:hypothetical protein BDD43_2872 [Mucilaginibacter gracilis]|uniref:Uncharacterized protein n=1 Tax=Mucilaginibacter gracilis TaxID=423350 RepID=A0A495J172_9SPHI|nr:hypothetical protein BDD43_2872 [Mucilaginibacter gracilis]
MLIKIVLKKQLTKNEPKKTTIQMYNGKLKVIYF